MSARVPVENHSHLSAGEFASLEAILAEQTNMARTLAWFRTHEPPLPPEDLVQQDEFTFDLIVPYGSKVWLTFAIN